jgi:hypothetical protein
VVGKIGSQCSPNKRSLEGTNLNTHNSFDVLGADYIADIVSDMGVVIPSMQFDKIELLKDIEVARHTLQEKVNSDQAPVDSSQSMDDIIKDGVP